MTSLAAVLIGLIVVVFSHRIAWWRPTVDYSRPRILMYHMVCEAQADAKFNKLRVCPERFEEQLRWLREQGWHFALMSDLEHPESLPVKTVILTFDDGYEDNLLNADPLLERFDARATLYVVEDRFDRDWSTSKKAHHDSGELMRESKLSDTQLEQMIESGRWEIGGHTRTHANLATLESEQRDIEIAEARQTLAERFAVPVKSFAYPFGIYGPEDVIAAKAAGFTTAVTTKEGIAQDVSAQAMELPRIKVSGKDSMLAFRQRIRAGFRGT
ncbi:polysaccharide deacetylase family protein [Congregibacter sp.]|uniref:polysaccharide deacetylase family protein n=1 Tax=Congregibacter sp. TaxID=2744308 RepID=UPI00385AE080